MCEISNTPGVRDLAEAVMDIRRGKYGVNDTCVGF
jgi:hypothetical protein